MGCRQVVRHLVLVQAFGGSSPSIPDKKEVRFILCLFFILETRMRNEKAGAFYRFGGFFAESGGLLPKRMKFLKAKSADSFNAKNPR